MVVLSKQQEDDSAVRHASIGERNSSMFNNCYYKKKTGKKDHKELYGLMLKGARSQPFEKGEKKRKGGRL